MRKDIVCVVLALLMIVGGILVLVEEANHSDMVTYTGSTVFDNEDSYQDFKEYCLSPGVEIISASAMSSKPPIYTQYELKMLRDAEFGYEYDYTTPNTADVPMAGGCALIAGGFLLGFIRKLGTNNPPADTVIQGRKE